MCNSYYLDVVWPFWSSMPQAPALDINAWCHWNKFKTRDIDMYIYWVVTLVWMDNWFWNGLRKNQFKDVAWVVVRVDNATFFSVWLNGWVGSKLEVVWVWGSFCCVVDFLKPFCEIAFANLIRNKYSYTHPQMMFSY